MTPDPEDREAPLSPEDEETVRRLLAAARGPASMPDDVASRLDDVLAGLQAERGGTAAGVPTVAGRRARRWPKVLVAAAAVAVIGVGVGNVMENTSGGGEAASSSKAGAQRDQAEVAPPGSDDSVTREKPEANALLGSAPTKTLPRIRTGSATVDAQRIYDLGLAAPAYGSDKDTQGRTAVAACALPDPAPGERMVAVRFDGRRATVLFRATEDGRREAQVYSCDDSESPVLVTTVDAR